MDKDVKGFLEGYRELVKKYGLKFEFNTYCNGAPDVVVSSDSKEYICMEINYDLDLDELSVDKLLKEIE